MTIMSKNKCIIQLGAINKITYEYTYPKIANKKDKYICPECDNDLILCHGNIKIHHFRHKTKNTHTCDRYNKPTETQIHKDAKLLLQYFLNKKILMSFNRICCACNINIEFDVPMISEQSKVFIEYRFEYNGLKIADVAIVDDNKLCYVFEICNTHKTDSENRPEPWFEINALELIQIANDINLTALKMQCIRSWKCDNCVKIENDKKENIKLKMADKIEINKFEETDIEKEKKR